MKILILFLLILSVVLCTEEFPKKELCLMGCKLLKKDYQRQICEIACNQIKSDQPRFPTQIASIEMSDSEFIAQLLNMLKTRGKKIMEKAKARLNGKIKTAGINIQLADSEEFPKKEICLLGCKLLKKDWQKELCKIGCEQIKTDSEEFPTHWAISHSERLPIHWAKIRAESESDAQHLRGGYHYMKYHPSSDKIELMEHLRLFAQKYFGKAAKKLTGAMRVLGIKMAADDFDKKSLCKLACEKLKGWKKQACKIGCKAL